MVKLYTEFLNSVHSKSLPVFMRKHNLILYDETKKNISKNKII